MHTLTCSHCGSIFQRHKPRPRAKRYYCTRDCRYRGQRVDTLRSFWSKVVKGDGCWGWRGSHFSTGYGAFWDGMHAINAHRFSWSVHFGRIPDKLHVLHRCDNRGCVNPAHLFLGTNADNIADRVAKGRSNRVVRPRGEKHWKAKLTADDVREVRRRRQDGRTLRAIADEFGVSEPTVFRIVHRQSWSHIE